MGKGRDAGRVVSGQTFCQQSRVGSGRVNVSPGRVGSKKSDPWTTLPDMQMITAYAYDHDICRWLRHMQMVKAYADDFDLCRWLPYNYTDNDGTCRRTNHMQMITWHADDMQMITAYADDYGICRWLYHMQMMICEEWGIRYHDVPHWCHWMKGRSFKWL